MGGATHSPAGEGGKPPVEPPAGSLGVMAAKGRKNGSTTTTFRMTPPEREAVRTAAASRDMGVSSFARVSTLRAAHLTPISPPRRDELGQALGPVLGELGRIGSNINQVAKVANSTGSAAAIAAAECLRADLEKLTIAVMSLKEGSSG